jgi:hypothetical protein
VSVFAGLGIMEEPSFVDLNAKLDVQLKMVRDAGFEPATSCV